MDFKQLRVNAGLSAEMLAAQMKKQHSTIRNWEAGNNEPKLKVGEVIKLCQLLNCDIYELESAIAESLKKQES